MATSKTRLRHESIEGHAYLAGFPLPPNLFSPHVHSVTKCKMRIILPPLQSWLKCKERQCG
eukprot:4559417-Karenia_brevis.AAC.2